MSNEEDFLMHYASQYYDPVKAHQYYEEHKKLVGKHSTKGFSDNQKEAWTYAKEQINSEKKQKMESARTERTNTTTSLRDAANQVREEIRAKIEAKIEEISNNAESQRNQYTALEVPKGATKLQRARIQRENAQRAEKRKEISSNESNSKSAAREVRSTQTAEISSGLKSAIESTREKCQTTIEQIKTEYTSKLGTEYENISRKVK